MTYLVFMNCTVSFENRVVQINYKVERPANNNGHNEIRYEPLKTCPEPRFKNMKLKKSFNYDASDMLVTMGIEPV